MNRIGLVVVLLVTVASCGPSRGDGDAGQVCSVTQPCETGFACVGGTCCPAARACSACCAAGSVCQAGECRLDCGGPLPCGEPGSEVCCGGGELCHRDVCTVPGAACDDPYDCGATAYCEPTVNQCLPNPPGGVTCLLPRPPTGQFTPQIAWEWTGSPNAPSHNQVMMTPVVANLTDDNNDTVVDENDIPDIIFNTFAGSSYGASGVMRAVSGDTGAELWSATNTASYVVPGSSLAVGDIDQDGLPEILACGTPVGGLFPLLAFEHDGTLKWATTDPQIVCGYSGPSIANLDQSGPPEILVRYAVVDAQGNLRWRGRAADGLNDAANFTTFYDIDNNGLLDVVGGNVAYDRNGVEIWSRTDFPDGFHAIADLDGDVDPDVVLVNVAEHQVMAFRGVDGANLWPAPQDINQGVPTPNGPVGGGPPTIADFDGDGLPEVSAAGGYGYVVFEGEDGAPKWFRPTIDLSSRVTGSSVFDFEDDGRAEVVYADERQLHIYDGTTGQVLFEMCNSSGTLWEYPLVADVDNDERAEIVVARNNYAFPVCLDTTAARTGIAVIEDALDNWVRTRRVWNQHTYHVTNIDERGSVPAAEPLNSSIAGLNNFRQNVQPIATRAAPDLVVTSIGGNVLECAKNTIRIEAVVKNIGDAGAGANIPVAFYNVDANQTTEFLGVSNTSLPILPGQSLLVSYSWVVPLARLSETFTFFAAVDDDGSGPGPGQGTSLINECNEDNNVSSGAVTGCSIIE